MNGMQAIEASSVARWMREALWAYPAVEAIHILALGLSASDRMLVVGPLYHVGAFATSTPTASRSRARATR